MIGDMETSFLGFPGSASGKPVNARDLRDADSIPGSVLNWLIPWRRTWQPTSVFLPGKSHGQRSLEGYSPWNDKE